MKQTKQVILTLIVLCLVLSTAVFRVQAAEVVDSGQCGEGVSWVLTDDGTLTISGQGPMEDRSRPWQDYEEIITRVVVNEGITAVGSYSFAYLEKVENVELPNTLVTIGDRAFRRCEAMKSITIPEGVTTLGENVFEDCMLESIHLPATLTEMATHAIYEMPTLKKITVTEGNPVFFVSDGILYQNLIPGSGMDYFWMVVCPNDRVSLVIPDDVKGLTQASLSCCEMLEDLTLPDGLMWSPGDLVSCTSLKNIYVHDSNPTYTSVDGILFSKDLLRIVRYPTGRPGTYAVPEGTLTIGESAFWGCAGLTEVELPDSVASIGSFGFRECSGLTGVRLPDGIVNIPENGFYGCSSLTSVTLPEGVTGIGEHAFSNCVSLVEVILPQSLTTIGEYGFSYCKALTSVTLHQNLLSIGTCAFSDSALEELVIPASVEILGEGAFYGSEALSQVHFLGDAPQATENSYKLFHENTELCFDRDASGWDDPVWEAYHTVPCDYLSTTVGATCTEAGSETITCTHCDLCIQTILPAAHRMGMSEVAQEPTETEEGRWERRCTVCGHTESVAIPAAPQQPLNTNNEGAQDMSLYFVEPIQSYLLDNGDGTFTRVEAWDEGVTVEHYDAEFQFVSRKVMPMELPIFGGFYEGTDYYFLVFGQANPEENDAREVIRVVRYTKDWLRLDHTSLHGANTAEPFHGGSLRMTQYEDMLYVHTCHLMYRSVDGRNHQANLMFSVRISDMTITDLLCEVSNNHFGYVSHSFNQFILTNGDKLITLNHGDGYPRSAVIMQFEKPAGESTFTGLCTAQNVLEFYGLTGDNNTGASLGAFLLSDNAYLTAGNSMVQDGSQKERNWKNIFLGVTTLDTIGDGTTTIKWITQYDPEEERMTSTPHLVKISGNEFLLMWTEYTMAWDDDILHYVFVDGQGELTSPIYEADALLSDCVPIVANDQVCWYVTERSTPCFYTISLDVPEQVTVYDPNNPCANGHTWVGATTDPTCTGDGFTTYTCFCGESYVDDHTDALGHSWNGSTCERCGAVRENPFEDVTERDYFFEPVLWAVEKGITSGTSATTFAPNATCTRAQVVTFLWRAMGKPAPENAENPFTDVKSGDYFYDAVLWAVENGITSGTGNGCFSPNNPCTRDQVVTFLWRAMGKPAPQKTDNPFTDVAENAYYYQSVLWAVENGITSGTSATTFAPSNPCTRGQVVTFLYRAYSAS